MQLNPQEIAYLEEQRRRGQAYYRLQALRQHNIKVIKNMIRMGVNPAEFTGDIRREYLCLCAEGYGDEFKFIELEDVDGGNITKEEENIK